MHYSRLFQISYDIHMFENSIDSLREKGLLRRILDREGYKQGDLCPDANRIKINNIRYINFSSNDYLGLASSQALAAGAREALETFPFGAGASRLLSGGTGLHRELETRIAAFKGTEGALLFDSGYHANVSTIPALAAESDVIFSDELNHASIIDGCRLSRARRIIYRHKDMEHLSSLLNNEAGGKKLVVTDTIFSMDGDIAPVDSIVSLCGQTPGAMLYLDDAHGTGVLGKGRGALAHFNIKPEPWIMQMGTMSKAMGSFGAFIAGTRDVTDWLTNTARGLIYSTALPSCVVAASIEAIGIIEKDNSLNEQLWHNQQRALYGIKKAGFSIVSEDSPIIAVLTGDIKTTLAFAERLKERGIYAPAIRPPTVKEPRIRVTISAAHTDEDIDALIRAFGDLKE
jgi:8-amino-7-oxononanoate synthase